MVIMDFKSIFPSSELFFLLISYNLRALTLRASLKSFVRNVPLKGSGMYCFSAKDRQVVFSNEIIERKGSAGSMLSVFFSIH